nr:MAG TPA: hypothetical protein [Caudoviricetes sp.]
MLILNAFNVNFTFFTSLLTVFPFRCLYYISRFFRCQYFLRNFLNFFLTFLR